VDLILDTMRINSVFEKCKKEDRKAFVAYIAAGDPDFETSLNIVDELVDAGIDILELGIPFSDPLADGEANQLASTRALDAGMTPSKVLQMACAIRKKHKELPLVLFTYINPIAYSAGKSFATFCKEAVESEIDAILPLDLPPEEMMKSGRRG
jgi:tryptophan synthase alpha chain